MLGFALKALSHSTLLYTGGSPFPDPDLTGTTAPNGQSREVKRIPSWRASAASVTSASSFISAANSSATVKVATERYLGKMGEILAGDSVVSRRAYEQALVTAHHEAHAEEAGERRLSVSALLPYLLSFCTFPCNSKNIVSVYISGAAAVKSTGTIVSQSLA